MKAILVIIVFFSFATINVQKSISDTQKIIETKKELTTKEDYYKALIKANGFDIKIKKNNIIAKSGYYNKLLIKNGFRLKSKKSTRLATNISQSLLQTATIS